jgi:hypothetical protein
MDFRFHVPISVGSVTGVGDGVDTTTELVGAGVAGGAAEGILEHPAIITSRMRQVIITAV